MAFCCRPSLIVLDEPTTGLDVSTQRHVLDTVRSLYSSYGVAAFYVSHDLAVVAELVAELVAEVAVMYAGRIVEIGPTANLRKTVGQIVAQPLEQLLGLGFYGAIRAGHRCTGGQAVIVTELSRLQLERELAMIFITHNLALVRKIAQSAVVLRDGAVVESGPSSRYSGIRPIPTPSC